MSFQFFHSLQLTRRGSNAITIVHAGAGDVVTLPWFAYGRYYIHVILAGDTRPGDRYYVRTRCSSVHMDEVTIAGASGIGDPAS